jgi:hypothetical protein
MVIEIYSVDSRIDDDVHSNEVDPQFVNAAAGDYRPKNANLKLSDGTWIGSEALLTLSRWFR